MLTLHRVRRNYASSTLPHHDDVILVIAPAFAAQAEEAQPVATDNWRRTVSVPARRRDKKRGRQLTEGRGGDGFSVTIEILETAGKLRERVRGRWHRRIPASNNPSRESRNVRRPEEAASKNLAQVLAALGHAARVVILNKLLEGPGTYRSLRRTTNLLAGPLYHHINQLRLAGLLRPKERDLYQLTRGGRNLIVAAMALGPLSRDRRQRPVAR